ncbi:MAG: DNA repair protein RecN [Lentimicrobiaceae bacterium]|nr:DNA repair protein RecN [Lentimicrobiaceae bacterium]
MLQHIHIENYTLIKHLSIDFREGFSVITGETGAGKSILVDALSLLLGQRADNSVLFDKNKKGIVEADFYIKDYGLEPFFEENDIDFDADCIIRREINSEGKSRTFINDTPVTINTLKQMSEKLLDIHSQHSNLLLQNAKFQLLIVDEYAQLKQDLDVYKKTFQQYKNLKKQYQELCSQTQSQDKEYFEFLHNELEESRLAEGEQENLEQELKLLLNAEDIKNKLCSVVAVSNSDEINALQLLQDCRQRLASISKHGEQLETLSARFNSLYIELKDIVNEADTLAENTIHDEQRIEKVNERLTHLYRLEQKHKVNSDKELLEVKAELFQKLDRMYQAENSLENLQKQIENAAIQLQELGENLSQKRRAALPQIASALQEKLQEMNISQAQIEIILEKEEQLTEMGFDRPIFRFSANKGAEMQPIAKIASGGELSRIMLGVKSLILQKNVLPTIIFDEIDSGVSGEVSAKMGKVMRDIARFSQVIAVTHLPQIASKAQTHYLIYKENEGEKTISSIKRLNDEERIVEIAKMISNEKISPSSVEAAKVLLAG